MDRPVLSKYERAHVISARMQQICNGCKARLVQEPDESLTDLVKRELELGLIPFKLARTFPDNTTEIHKLSEMVISDGSAAPVVK
jgi:DNA-directed RNA polymerase subunit K/omega